MSCSNSLFLFFSFLFHRFRCFGLDQLGLRCCAALVSVGWRQPNSACAAECTAPSAFTYVLVLFGRYLGLLFRVAVDLATMMPIETLSVFFQRPYLATFCVSVYGSLLLRWSSRSRGYLDLTFTSAFAVSTGFGVVGPLGRRVGLFAARRFFPTVDLCLLLHTLVLRSLSTFATPFLRRPRRLCSLRLGLRCCCVVLVRAG